MKAGDTEYPIDLPTCRVAKNPDRRDLPAIVAGRAGLAQGTGFALAQAPVITPTVGLAQGFGTAIGVVPGSRGLALGLGTALAVGKAITGQPVRAQRDPASLQEAEIERDNSQGSIMRDNVQHPSIRRAA